MKQGPVALDGELTSVAIFVAGSYSKNIVGPGNWHGGAGLPVSNTLPLGSSAAGASIGKIVFPPPSFKVGPAVHVPGCDGTPGGQ